MAFDPKLHPRLKNINNHHKRWCEKALQQVYVSKGEKCGAVPIMKPEDMKKRTEEEGDEEGEGEEEEKGEEEKKDV